MNGHTHIVIGMSAGIVLAANLDADTAATLAVVAAAGLGALVPDIDTPNSLISRKLWPLSLLARPFLKHRGFTHGLLAYFLVNFAILLAVGLGVPNVLWGFPAGWATHLIADLCTKDGLRLLWPRKRDFRVLPRRFAIRTGSLGEAIIALVFFVWVLYQGFGIPSVHSAIADVARYW